MRNDSTIFRFKHNNYFNISVYTLNHSMLLPTMTDLEVYAEVVRDYHRLEETTLQRLHHEYFKERQRLKIDKTKVYPRTYRVKSGTKNNWLIIITKSFSELSTAA
jgi:hypothetical protein